MAATKLFAIKVFNVTKSCVLVMEFDNGVVSFPVLEIPFNADPISHIDELLSQINGKFNVISAINILNKTESDGDDEYVSTVYELQYDGRISTILPPAWKYKYVCSKWMQLNMLKKHGNLNYPTSAFVESAAGG